MKTSKYLYQSKDVSHGCGPKQKVERVLEFTIPVEDPDLPDDLLKLKLSESDVPVVRCMTSTVQGNLI